MPADLRSALRFELTKIRTQPSLVWSVIAFAVVTFGVGILSAFYLRGREEGTRVMSPADFDAVAFGHSGLRLGVIALVVFGVLVVASEYSGRTARSTSLAVPRRGVLFGAKILATTLVAGVVSIVVVVGSFVATKLVLGGPNAASLSDAATLRSLVGGVLFCVLLALLAVGVAALLKSAALAIGILFPLLFMFSTILSNIGAIRDVTQFLPDIAGGQALLGQAQDDTVVTPVLGVVVLAAWAAAALGSGWGTLRHRDL